MEAYRSGTLGRWCHPHAMIRNMIRQLTGKEPISSDCPDELVAHGAALYADALLAQDSTSQNARLQLVNVNSHSLGVVGVHKRTGEKTNVVLIPKNTRLPARASRVFRTARRSQRSIQVTVVEGESSRPDECIALGECVVRDLPPSLPPGTKVEAQYRYAANGRISAVARVPSVRHSSHVEIKRDRVSDLDDLKICRNPASCTGPLDLVVSILRRLHVSMVSF
jgi:molecular chaperone DnaK